MTDPILTEAERRSEIAREDVVRAYAAAQRVKVDDRRIHIEETPVGSLLSYGPLSRAAWGLLAVEAMKRATGR